jgi:hypothetical protein
MIAVVLFIAFLGLMFLGVPIGVALGVGGALAIALENPDTMLWGTLAAPQNFYAGIAKYPLLALPMFVLVGSIFDRSGVARRMVDFAVACTGRGPGMLPMVAILVAMVLGGISGSGPANAAAVGGVMIAAMALPHLSHANQFNSRVQGQFRHSFWAEVYEAVLAWYIFRPTLYAVINPKAGKFNVTAKGGYIERDYFDWGIARPYVVLLACACLLTCGAASPHPPGPLPHEQSDQQQRASGWCGCHIRLQCMAACR